MTRVIGAGAAVSRVNGAIPVGPGLYGDLAVPESAVGVTLFAHGSGSSRFSPRNRLVADALNRRGIATLLFDLLTPAEESQRSSVFDVELLAERLERTTQWLERQPLVEGLAPCYFGASTGAAAALSAAARAGDGVRAVVSRGGRADLAGAELELVTAPTLLIVGGYDETVLGLNREAFERLTCERRLVVIRRAGHLFDEPGTLERVAELTGDWFERHLTGQAITGDADELETVDPVPDG